VSAVIIISIFLLVVTSFAVFRSKRSQSNEVTGELPPAHLRGLFSGEGDGRASDGRSADAGAAAKASEEHANSLRARAAAGDLEVLPDADATRDEALYAEILNTLADAGEAPEQLYRLSDFITRSEGLRTSRLLAGRILEDWKQSPARSSVPRMLRVVALSDDAAAYRNAIQTVFQFWREGRLHGSSSEELCALFESEYWMLSPDARRSGEGFVLKEELSEMRRRPAVAARRESTPNTEAG
jgi:hypothetical protein